MLPEFLKERTEDVNNKLEEFLPKNITDEWVESVLPNCTYDKNVLNSITEPIWEFLMRGGKRWRPILMMLCCDAVGGNPKVTDFIPFVELIHNGTLMVDDIEDNSDTRRGKPCTHKIYGNDVAINTGNLMYYLPYLILKKSDIDSATKLKIHEATAEDMFKLHLGQGMDIYWHNGGELITEDLYLQMCAFKTGTLARMSAKIGGTLGGASKNQIDALGSFAESLGVGFQIQDDILNIANKGWGKDFGDDINEGKRTLMVIYVLKNGTEVDVKRLTEILDMHTNDKSLIEEAIDILKKYDTIDYAKSKSQVIVKSAWEKLEPLLDETDAKEKLKLFCDFVVDREI